MLWLLWLWLQLYAYHQLNASYRYINKLREHSVTQYNSRSVHSLSLQQPFARTQSYYHSFVPHTISI